MFPSAQHPSHQYVAEGLYTVTLMVTNGAGSDTLVRTIFINVPEPAQLTQFVSGVFGPFMLSAYRKRG